MEVSKKDAGSCTSKTLLRASHADARPRGPRSNPRWKRRRVMSCCCGCAPGMHVALCAARHAPHVLTASQFLSSRCPGSSQSAAGSAKKRELDASRMSADGGLGMTATVSRDSTQLHLPWMVVCRNQHHANCQPVDAPAGTRSRVAPADDICRYRSRDICDCQTEERGHWCASSSV